MRIGGIILGVVLLLVGLGFVCPQIAHQRGGDEMQVPLLMLGGALSVAGIATTAFAGKPSRVTQ